jgi:hypothetical protein
MRAMPDQAIPPTAAARAVLRAVYEPAAGVLAPACDEPRREGRRGMVLGGGRPADSPHYAELVTDGTGAERPDRTADRVNHPLVGGPALVERARLRHGDRSQDGAAPLVHGCAVPSGDHQPQRSVIR